MPKKKFIDKKKATTFHLLHRSQRDVAEDLVVGDTHANGMILWPADGSRPPEPSGELSQARQRLQQAGLLEEAPRIKDGGGGVFIDASGRTQNAPLVQEEVLEVPIYDSVALNADCMDDDVAQALFDFDDSDFEAFDDDFVVEVATAQPDAPAFDFDAHIAELMRKAQKQDEPGLPENKDSAFFGRLEPLHEQHDVDEDALEQFESAPGPVSALTTEEERVLCEKFEETLLEYDSDDLGDMPEEEIVGDRPLDDTQLVRAMDDFQTEKVDDILMTGVSRQRDGGSGFSALMGNRMVPAHELHGVPEEEPALSAVEVLQQATDRLSLPPVKPPAEDVLIDGISYYSQKERNPFDCESILSTYSDLANHPLMIESSKPKSIELSKKTGLPLGVLPSRYDRDEDADDDDDEFDETSVSVNKGVARNKKESKEEKRARKATVKQERAMARIQKKATRQVYAEEFQKHAVDMATNDVAGKSVIRIR